MNSEKVDPPVSAPVSINLVCPLCKSDLKEISAQAGDQLKCTNCQATYEVTDSIPCLIPQPLR